MSPNPKPTPPYSKHDRGRPNRLRILHQDDDLIVVDKPPGMLSEHGLIDETGVLDILGNVEDGSLGAPPLPGVGDGSMDCSIMSETRLGDAEDGETPALSSLVPLETDASGLMLWARNIDARQHFEAQLAERRLTLTYLAVVRGMVMKESGVMDRPLRPPQQVSGLAHVDDRDGVPAVTEWRLRDRFIGFALLECVPRTRIKHQIRVHLQDLEMPLAVDSLYGGAEHLMLSSFKAGYRRSRRRVEWPLIQRPTLHAWSISFEQPRTGETLSFEAPPPKDLRATLHQLDRFGRIPQ